MSEEDVLVVTCPVCGKVTQKSIFTYSEVRCQRCHRDLTAFADLGVVVGIDMNKKRSKEDVDRLERYMTHGKCFPAAFEDYRVLSRSPSFSM